MEGLGERGAAAGVGGVANLFSVGLVFADQALGGLEIHANTSTGEAFGALCVWEVRGMAVCG